MKRTLMFITGQAVELGIEVETALRQNSWLLRNIEVLSLSLIDLVRAPFSRNIEVEEKSLFNWNWLKVNQVIIKLMCLILDVRQRNRIRKLMHSVIPRIRKRRLTHQQPIFL